MAAITIDAPAADADLHGPVPARTAGPAAADRSPAMVRPTRTVRSWPLLVLAAPAAAEVWSGWVGIAQKTGFGLVSPLPGIWPSLHLDTSITLPVGVEAYAAYALRAWLSGEHAVSAPTRRFAKWSAVFSFALGMAGQVAYHLLAQAGTARAPWPVTTIVSCLPVLVLGMGTALAHMLRADGQAAAERPDHHETAGPAGDHGAGDPAPGSGPPARTRTVPRSVRSTAAGTRRPAQSEASQVRLIASKLAAAGKPVSRRTLRSAGIKGSNQALNAMARRINAERAGAGGPPSQTEEAPARS